jgi:chitin disaccharide deacetylase
MIKITISIIATVVTLNIALAQPKPAQLIVRGDDMGYSHSGNDALIKCYTHGIQKTIEVIVPSPWFPEAVRLLKENPGVDVGVHLAITSEWDNIKWRPVSNCKSLTDGDGYFYPFIWPNQNYPGRALKEHAWTIDDIEREFRAQIELAKKHIPQLSHISAHMGCTNIDPAVTALARKLAKEYKIDIDLDELGVVTVSYVGAHRTLQEKKSSFIKMLDSLQPGKKYMFLDHPGIDGPELRAISHIGYEFVAEDRQGVTTLWTDPEIIKLIRQKNIQLISYRDLK